MGSYIIFLLLLLIVVLMVSKVVNQRILKRKIHQINRDKGKVELLFREPNDLPQPLKNYLKYTNFLNKKYIDKVEITQGGLFRTKLDQKWMPIKAKQYINTLTHSFIWIGNVNMANVLPVQAVDHFIEGKGSLTVKLFSWLKVQKATGQKIDHGEEMRYFTEMIWYPTSFLNSIINWELIDSTTVLGECKYFENDVQAYFYFNEDGALTKIHAKRYLNEDRLLDWEISSFEYKTFDDVKIPYKANVSWKLENGREFTYYQLEILKIKYE
ncbi:hypothetical protein LC087_15905 [Bacillus carboniphilus]|uniref:Uncharacterized protein n=1 Tax=Bacillus carboniphilus TaxID=86663 RepID=A0ABY9JS40_9BACI|nr:DUF6544 family protein [Bacillus carboniphilus]WLR42206.1 hypothetical protein LC087_15905 [Bacillus carboniphilus]